MKNILPMFSAAVSRGRAYLLLALCASLLLILPTACRAVDPIVKIGLVAPFEGRHRSLGYDAIYAARLAVREANQAGGIGDYRIELVAFDDGGNGELARQAAAALAVDPDVVAVVGHGLPESTAAARPLYESQGLPLLVLGEDPFAVIAPELLAPAFREAYAALTPFDEVAGPYAGPTYHAVQTLLQALTLAETGGPITRPRVAAALEQLQ